MSAGSTLLICTRCREPGSDPSAPRPGAALLRAVRAALPLAAGTAVAGLACLSACTRPCAVALLAPGRVTFLFGDLPADARSAAELLAAATAHAAAPDGWMPRAVRPERLRAGILARIPPLHWLPDRQPDGQPDPIAWPS